MGTKLPKIPDITKRPEPGPLQRRVQAGYLLCRTLILWASAALVAVVVSSLVGGLSESTTVRLVSGLASAVLLAPLVRAWLRASLKRRLGRRPGLGGSWFLATFNLALVAVLCLGFSFDTGRALRRRGDWFLGKSEGWIPRHYRQQLAHLSHWMERLDGTFTPGMAGEPAGSGKGATPVTVAASTNRTPWYHPLAGPRRVLPPNSSCRFGAARKGNRPAECLRGHCGVDLFLPPGAPVHAVHDGVVFAVQRNAQAGGVAGKFLWLSHQNGDIISSYVHLRHIRPRIRKGARVRAGEIIGSLGSTGFSEVAPHLHFAISLRYKGRRQYVDPEPLIWDWPLVDSPSRGRRLAVSPTNP